MRIDADIDAVPSTNTPIENASEWNGKEVQSLPTACHAWLVLQIPIRSQNPLPNLAEKVTCSEKNIEEKAGSNKSIFPSKTECSFTAPTVEEVLQRHDLQFAPRLVDREVRPLPNSNYAWIVIPLQSKEQTALTNKETKIDTNDYRNIERVLEQNGLWFAPRAEADPFFSMTKWC
jgi:hypothetical protein